MMGTHWPADEATTACAKCVASRGDVGACSWSIRTQSKPERATICAQRILPIEMAAPMMGGLEAIRPEKVWSSDVLERGLLEGPSVYIFVD